MDEAVRGTGPGQRAGPQGHGARAARARQDDPALDAHHGAGREAVRLTCASSRAARSSWTARSPRSSECTAAGTCWSASTARAATPTGSSPTGGSWPRRDVSGQYAELELAPGADAQEILQGLGGLRRPAVALRARRAVPQQDLHRSGRARGGDGRGPAGGGGPCDKILAVIRREFVERVRQRWFWVIGAARPGVLRRRSSSCRPCWRVGAGSSTSSWSMGPRRTWAPRVAEQLDPEQECSSPSSIPAGGRASTRLR